MSPAGGRRPSASRFDIPGWQSATIAEPPVPSHTPGHPRNIKVVSRSDAVVSDAGFVIRPAQSGDRPAWLALRHQLWPDGTEQQHAADISRFFNTPGRGPGTMPEQVFIAASTGKVPEAVGFAEVSRRAYAEGCETSPVGFLEGWYVIAARRRQGIGRALVDASEAWARANGCREFASDAVADNTLSATAHRALGFEEVEVIRCFRKDLIP